MARYELENAGWVTTYPTGALRASQIFWRHCRRGWFQEAWNVVRSEVGLLAFLARKGAWPVLGDRFSGFRSELDDNSVFTGFPAPRHGDGWTHRRALRSLERRVEWVLERKE
jgi:hypothetical protein